jgi:hypothetical protein
MASLANPPAILGKTPIGLRTKSCHLRSISSEPRLAALGRTPAASGGVGSLLHLHFVGGQNVFGNPPVLNGWRIEELEAAIALDDDQFASVPGHYLAFF